MRAAVRLSVVLCVAMALGCLPQGEKPASQVENRQAARERSWPVDFKAVPEVHRNLAYGYGTFASEGGLRFHGGIGVPLPVGRVIRPVEAGTVSFVDTTSAHTPHRLMVVNSGTADEPRGWLYRGIEFADNAMTKKPFATGDKIDGNVLGTVAEQPSSGATVVSLEYGNGWDALALQPKGRRVMRPAEDPLEKLPPLPDKVPPTITAIHFRAGPAKANHPLRGGTRTATGNAILQRDFPVFEMPYFRSRDHSDAAEVGHYAVSQDTYGLKKGDTAVGLVAEMYDQVIREGNKIGVKTAGFAITGDTVPAKTGRVKSFDFSGGFAPDVHQGGVQTHESLWDARLVRTVYSGDDYCETRDRGPYFYNLTHGGEGGKVLARNRGKVWHTDRVIGSAWDAASAKVARSNAEAQWPDGYYTVTAYATDAAGHETEGKQWVLLDNWTQAITLTEVGRTEAGKVRLEVCGEQFTAKSSVVLYLVKAGTLVPGAKLADVGTRLADVATDAEGRFSHTLELTAAPAWTIVADYNGGDGVYQPRLDAVATLKSK